MQVADLMSTPAITIRPDATVGEAADLMLDRQISCLPVVDGRGRLVGILTHSDFGLHHRFMPLVDNLFAMLGSWATPESLEEVAQKMRSKPVKDVMTHDVITILEDAGVAEVAESILSKKINRLPVMRGKKLVGVITRHDLLKLVASGPQIHQENQGRGD